MSARFFWIASYPKSGNTWLRLMLRSLAGGGAPVDLTEREGFAPLAAHRSALDYWCGVPSSDLSEDEAMALRPLLYAEQAAVADATICAKVHDLWERTPAGTPLFPPELTLGSVYLVRDPRDVAVSFAHHRGTDVDAAIALMNRSDATLPDHRSHGRRQLRQRLARWCDHVESWRAADPVPLLLRYEDMIADPRAALAATARRVGWTPSPAELDAAIEHTSFATLQSAEARDGFVERPATARAFFRSGRAGDWRDVLTATQARRIEADHGGVMAELGYL